MFIVSFLWPETATTDRNIPPSPSTVSEAGPSPFIARKFTPILLGHIGQVDLFVKNLRRANK